MDNNTLVPGFDDTKVDYLQIRLQDSAEVPKGLRVFLSGELNTQNSPQFQRKIDLCISAGFTKLLFSCGSLSYMSSNGVGSFAYILKTLKEYDGRLCLFAVPPRVYEVLSLLGFATTGALSLPRRYSSASSISVSQ
jgi:anti-anti-sigma factor